MSIKDYLLTRFYYYLKKNGIKEAKKLNINGALTLLWAASTLAWESKVNFFHDKEIDHHLHMLGQKIYGNFDEFPKHNKIRLGYITSGILEFGGLTQHIENIIRFHNRDKFEIYIYSTECSFDHSSHDNARNRLIRLRNHADKIHLIKYNSSLTDKVNEIIDEINKDEIEIFSYFLAPNDVVAQIVASCFTNHKNIYFHDSSHIFCLGSYQYDLHIDITQKYYNRCETEQINDNICYIPLPGRNESENIDYNQIGPIRSKYGLNKTDFLTITVGNPQKNIWNNNFDYIEIIGEIISSNKNIYHVLVADGMDKIKKLITKKYPSAQNRIIVEKSTPNLMEILRDCDLYLSSYPLGGGLTILDAISLKLPVVSIELQREMLNCDEIIAANKEEYITIAQKLIFDNKFREKISNMLFETYKNIYAPRIIVNRIEEIYKGYNIKPDKIYTSSRKLSLNVWRIYRFRTIFNKLQTLSIRKISIQVYKIFFELAFR